MKPQKMLTVDDVESAEGNTMTKSSASSALSAVNLSQTDTKLC